MLSILYHTTNATVTSICITKSSFSVKLLCLIEDFLWNENLSSLAGANLASGFFDITDNNTNTMTKINKINERQHLK